MRTLRFLSACSILTALAGAAAGQPPTAPGAAVLRQRSPIGALVYIISPADGESVGRTFTVRFGLTGMGVAPAGVVFENTGHHHLIIDDVTPRLDQAIPADDQHRHFGKGQTEVELTLPPGEHTLQLVFADANHVPHDPALVSKRIHITVK